MTAPAKDCGTTSGDEHFVTVFDRGFLPYGMVLADTLAQVMPAHRLWVVAMDDEVAGDLARLARPRLSVIPLAELETPAHLRVKPLRSRGEWCWTMTPSTFAAVAARAQGCRRVTYLDADLAFYSSPAAILDEFTASGRGLLITEHAYDPAWDQSGTSGRFCVQFLCVADSADAWNAVRWWEERCIEWCYARAEPGLFGDQKYLDRWPELFPEAVHIHKRPELTQGPWNRQRYHAHAPVFYHFHGVRPRLDRDWAVLQDPYRVDAGAAGYYRGYVDALQAWCDRLAGMGIVLPPRPQAPLRARLHGLLARHLLGRHPRFQHMRAV